MGRLFKQLAVLVLVGILLYAGAMIILRLRVTEMAYEFEELKKTERSLKEEQLRLRADVSHKLSPHQMKLKGFSEPLPQQVIVIP